MARSEAGPKTPKVADFGLAKAAEADATGATRTGLAMGTPAFMAPEQIRDAAKVDARADVFSLGCILYQLACGETAFVGPDVMSVWNHICNGDYRAPREIDPTLPERFQLAIEGALRVEPEDRLPSVAALLEVLGGQQDPPKPPSGARRPDPAIARWLTAGAVALGIAVMVAFGALGVVAGTWAWQAASDRDIGDGDGGAPAGGVPIANLPVCTTSSRSDEPLGWVRVSAVSPFRQPPREGSTIELVEDTAVLDKVFGKEEICRLPKGTEVVIPKDTVRRRGLWVSLAQDGFTLPR